MGTIAGLSSTEYHRRYYYKRRAKLIALLGDSCVWCGSEDDLQFDHIDPAQKSFNISHNMTASNPAVRAEVAKCQLLCRDCHIEKTRQAALEAGFTHGSWYGWMHKRCTCEECHASRRAFHDARNAQRRGAGATTRGPYGRETTHGEQLHYKRGCRCVECRAANAAYVRELMARKAA